MSITDAPAVLLAAHHAAALKRATHAALAAIGGSDRAARFTRVSARDLRKCADHDVGNAARFLSLDVAAQLDLAAGAPHMARALARISGAAVTSIDAAPAARLSDALKESGEAIAAMAALASHDLRKGGAWGRDAARAALKEVRDQLAACAALEKHLSDLVEGSS